MPSPQFTGPQPPAGRQFCLMCAAIWKAEALDRARARGQDPGSTNLELAVLMGGELPDWAVTTTMFALPIPPGAGMPGQAMVAPGPSCWTHAQPIKVMESQLAIATPGDPMAGAVDLGARRRR